MHPETLAEGQRGMNILERTLDITSCTMNYIMLVEKQEVFVHVLLILKIGIVKN